MNQPSLTPQAAVPFTVPILSTRELTVGYPTKNGPLELEKDLNINVFNGELVCLIGPNGCGKSTLLNILGLIDSPSGGEHHF
ncbi:MAG: ATP-binding cassette domain-containing protein, partial [Bacteroidota bacterium]